MQIRDSIYKTSNSAIKGMILLLNLDFHCLCDRCLDGAANMSGGFSSVQKRISDSEPRSLCVHCSNLYFYLVMQEASRSCDVIGDALSAVKNGSNAILDSNKHKSV